MGAVLGDDDDRPGGGRLRLSFGAALVVAGINAVFRLIVAWVLVRYHLGMQFDLFDDSRDVMLRNDVVAALRKRDEVAVREALLIFSAKCPDDDSLQPLTALSNMVAAPPSRPSARNEALNLLEHMETAVTAAANRFFGVEEARHWLAPLWRSLAANAVELGFDVERPKAHAAFMLLKAGDWAAAEARIRTIPS